MLTLLLIIALIYFVPKAIAKTIRDNDQRIHDEFTKLDNNK
jgi:F0F1-type ATP synthase membrane subunit b/b'